MNIEILSPSLEKFDLGGVLYHANYFLLFEQAREKFLEISGLPYPELVKENQHLAVVSANIEYKKPIFYGEKLVLELNSSVIKRTNFILHYKLYNKKSSLLHTEASTRLVFVKNLEATKIPETLLSAIKDIKIA